MRVWALVRERADIVHPEAARLLADARFGAGGLRAVRAQLHWLRTSPRRYLATFLATVAGNRTSLRFLVRALVVFPIAAAWAVEMADEDVDVVHAHFATHAALAAHIIHRLTGIPYTFTAHAHDIYVDQTMLAEKARCAAAVVTISDYNARTLQAIAGPSLHHLHVIRCGVDLSRFCPENGVPVEASTKRVLCVAAFEEKKGHRHLLTALAQLRSRGLAVELVLVGDGELRPRLQRQAEELGIADAIHWRGRLESDAVLTEIRAADCFVLPSVVDRRGRMEGVPVALMEAMAVGVPVVATDVSGVCELVRPDDTGWLVPPGDPAALAEAIAAVLEGHDVSTRVAAARNLVSRVHDLHANAGQMVDLFSSIAAVSAEAEERLIST
ncbi:MAG: hypothetical protein QOD38_2165 [Acidimicrobiaceae bacterium]